MNGSKIAAVGDASEVGCWSGIPFHFLQACRQAGFATEPWRIDLSQITWQRYAWNGLQGLRGRKGGFQYSPWFLHMIESQIPSELWEGDIITFNQHFPRATTVARRGGQLSHYLDAPFVALASGRGLDLRLPSRVVRQAIALERENYSASKRVITMGRWAAEAIKAECGVPPSRVHVILPGANLELPDGWMFPEHVSRAGVERPFTLGFVGKDWLRKGLMLVIAVRDELARRGWQVQVRAAGDAPHELQRREGVEFAGFIDKSRNPEDFVRFLASCDLGCLFSEREALGISTLEFLRVGVPVAGFAHEGMADTLPLDAGFRFESGSDCRSIADAVEYYLQDEVRQARFRANARCWSEKVTWERCIGEFQELWTTGTVANPVQPWRGLPTVATP
ncbi:glycosyltransferase family 4 protein [Luteolibacter flavescens]|uniref:Glycosyltransferase family 4 protein n=1 Tax=Luteolibacter flavescens TaxID=1859460 RepID=A0ABT3FVR3_9BACT|nr:glycosyltransferase family 4 protein [Luteolibacter flavescens]MCW1887316.1 glycosyltransferase family 4 protein [Luteolibacter flavescens]